MEKITDVDSVLVSNLKLNVASPDSGTMVYDSRIEEVTYNTFFIAMPSDRGMMMPISPGSRVDISFIANGGRYFFKTIITNKIMKNINLLELKKPEMLYKSELREFFRIDVLQKVRVYFMKQIQGRNNQVALVRDKTLDGICINVSGGGLKFLVETEIQKDTTIEMDFSHFIEGLDSVMGLVVRCVLNEKNMYEVGVNYLDLKDSQRDKIIKYTFKRQIEMRKLTQP